MEAIKLLRGPYEGQGAQAKAWQEAPYALMTRRPLTGKREYWGAPTLEAREEAVLGLIKSGWEVNERVDGTRPLRPFLDYDGGPDTEEVLDTLIDAFEAEALKLGVPEDLARPLVTSNAREGKLSAHLIARGWTLPTGREAVLSDGGRVSPPFGFLGALANPGAKGGRIFHAEGSGDGGLGLAGGDAGDGVVELGGGVGRGLPRGPAVSLPIVKGAIFPNDALASKPVKPLENLGAR